MARRGRPLEVDDWDLTQTIEASSSESSKELPIYVIAPVVSLGSLLGSATASEYSQLEGYRGSSIGKLKIDFSAHLISQVGTHNRFDTAYFAAALFIGKAIAADGTPDTNLQSINPWVSGVAPESLETLKDPWVVYSFDQVSRLIWIRRWRCAMGHATNDYSWSTQLHFRTRRGYRIRETDCLYAMYWVAPEFVNASTNDTYIGMDWHIGVPHAFRKK